MRRLIAPSPGAIHDHRARFMDDCTRHRRNPPRDPARPRAGSGAGAHAGFGHFARHGTAGAGGQGAGKPMGRDALPLAGRRFPLPGEVWLLSRGARCRRPRGVARQARFLPASASRCFPGARGHVRAYPGCGAGSPRRTRRQYGNRAEYPLGRSALARRTGLGDWRGRGWAAGCLSARAHPGHGGDNH